MHTAEVIERALRQHAEGAAAAERGLGHGVDRAVATGRNDDAIRRPCRLHRAGSELADAVGPLGDEEGQLAPCLLACGFDAGLGLARIAAARARVDDDEQRRMIGGRRARDGRGV